MPIFISNQSIVVERNPVTGREKYRVSPYSPIIHRSGMRKMVRSNVQDAKADRNSTVKVRRPAWAEYCSKCMRRLLFLQTMVTNKTEKSKEENVV